MVKTETGLEYWDIKTSDGSKVSKNDRVNIHYKVALSEEEILTNPLNDSFRTNTPIDVIVSKDHLLLGVYEGLLNTRTGGSVRLLKIPPKLAYGERGIPGYILSQSTLYVELTIRFIL